MKGVVAGPPSSSSSSSDDEGENFGSLLETLMLTSKKILTKVQNPIEQLEKEVNGNKPSMMKNPTFGPEGSPKMMRTRS